MRKTPVELLKEYVNQPSGSLDAADVAEMARIIAADFESIGFNVQTIPGTKCGPVLKCRIGSGKKQLMLMGHMDTVFPRSAFTPWTETGDGKAVGSGCMDMKGGIVVMLNAAENALKTVDLNEYSLCAVINPDEEIGSPESHEVILETARESFAALSFEPCGENGRLTCARKGVTSVLISCRGVPGHAGAQYKECSSAIQALCAQITKLYRLRDDEKDISFNAGFITGGTAENVVAPTAACKCEFRYFDESLKPGLAKKIVEICADEPVKGAVTTVEFGASHPAIDVNEKSRALYDAAKALGDSMNIPVRHERTGGAGDISIAGQAGIGVLDGLGVDGGGAHTKNEWVNLATIDDRIRLASALICAVLKP